MTNDNVNTFPAMAAIWVLQGRVKECMLQAPTWVDPECQLTSQATGQNLGPNCERPISQDVDAWGIAWYELAAKQRALIAGCPIQYRKMSSRFSAYTNIHTSYK